MAALRERLEAADRGKAAGLLQAPVPRTPSKLSSGGPGKKGTARASSGSKWSASKIMKVTVDAATTLLTGSPSKAAEASSKGRRAARRRDGESLCLRFAIWAVAIGPTASSLLTRTPHDVGGEDAEQGSEEGPVLCGDAGCGDAGERVELRVRPRDPFGHEDAGRDGAQAAHSAGEPHVVRWTV